MRSTILVSAFGPRRVGFTALRNRGRRDRSQGFGRGGNRMEIEVFRRWELPHSPSENFDVPQPTYFAPDLDSFCLLDGLSLTVTGQQVQRDRAILECRLAEDDLWCRDCSGEGVSRGTVFRRLTHLPLGWRPTTLKVRVRRYRCSSCSRVCRKDTTKATVPRTKLSRRAVLWALKSVEVVHRQRRRRTDCLLTGRQRRRARRRAPAADRGPPPI